MKFVFSAALLILGAFIINPVSVQGAEGLCADLFIRMPDLGFPVEKYYPYFRVQAGVIPRGSKPFILWRQNTSPHIPDSAFNFRYYTEAQKLKAARFASVTTSPVTDRAQVTVGEHLPPRAAQALEHFYSRPHEIYKFEYDVSDPYTAAPYTHTIAKFGSVENMFNALKINPNLDSAKMKEVIRLGVPNAASSNWAKYFLLPDGKAYLLFQHEIKSIQKALEISWEFYHEDLAKILFMNNTSSVEVISVGYLYFSTKENKLSVYDPYTKITRRNSSLDLAQFFKDSTNAPIQ